MLLEDARTKVSISKVDIADGKEVEGAHIQVIEKDKAGKETVVEEWDSTTEAHVIEGLKTGVEFIIRETTAPEGYLVTTDTTFTIDAHGNVTSTGTVSEEGVLLVEDARTAVRVLKTDIADGKELAGAKIQKDDSGSGGSKKPSSSSTSTRKKSSSKTGDDSDAMMWLLIWFGAAGSLVYVTKKRRNSN